MKNTARLPRTAGLRTLSELSSELTKAGLDPSRITERAEMLAKVQGAKRKRAREEDEDAEMDVDGDAEEVGEGEWMDVDEDDAALSKRVKANSGAAISRRDPRSNRQLAGMRDEAVSKAPHIVIFVQLTVWYLLQQASKALKLRNLGQRERNMHARAGESDRAIKTKMVGCFSVCVGCESNGGVSLSQSICLLESGRWARRIADSRFHVLLLHSFYCCLLLHFIHYWAFMRAGN
jgi:nucleolar GTP-binding protein